VVFCLYLEQCINRINKNSVEGKSLKVVNKAREERRKNSLTKIHFSFLRFKGKINLIILFLSFHFRQNEKEFFFCKSHDNFFLHF
jgi:hypothetical protein